MTIQSEINRIKANIADCYDTLTAKGATIPATENVANLASCIRSIPTTPPAFETQSGDTIVTSAGTPLTLDGISSLSTAPSVTDSLLTFADDGQDTVKFSMQDLKGYVNPTPQTKQRLVSVADNLDNNKLVLYTDDGVTWNTSTMPNTRNWGNVFYGNGKFIVPASGTNTYAYSTDGISWTEGTLPVFGYWRGGAYGNGKYVMFDNSSYNTASKVCYSEDGLTWNYYTFPTISPNTNPLTIRNIIFDGSLFVLIGKENHLGGADTIGKSSDGINWTLYRLNDTGINSTTSKTPIEYYQNKYYIGVCSYSSGEPNDQKVLISSDLENWTVYGTWHRLNFYPRTSCGINGEVKFFAGLSSLSQQSADYINVDSSDNVTFVDSSIPRLDYQGGANILNGKAIVIGYGSDQYIYSTDGTTWSTGTLPASSGWWGSCVGEVQI